MPSQPISKQRLNQWSSEAVGITGKQPISTVTTGVLVPEIKLYLRTLL